MCAGLDFFVILNHPNGGYTPLMDDDFEISRFRTEYEARQAAEDSFLGSKFGWQVFDVNQGL